MATEDSIDVLPTGKKLRTFLQTINGVQVETEAVAQIDGLVTTKSEVDFIPDTSRPTTIYVGYAVQGTGLSTPFWTIYKTVFTYVSSTSSDILSIENTTSVDVAWSARTTSTYS